MMAETIEDGDYAKLDEKTLSAKYNNKQQTVKYINVKTTDGKQQNIAPTQESAKGFISTRKLVWMIVVTAILCITVSMPITAAICLVVTKSDCQTTCNNSGQSAPGQSTAGRSAPGQTVPSPTTLNCSACSCLPAPATSCPVLSPCPATLNCSACSDPIVPVASCAQISCLNAGVCVHKEPACQCPDDYTGDRCQTVQPWKKEYYLPMDRIEGVILIGHGIQGILHGPSLVLDPCKKGLETCLRIKPGEYVDFGYYGDKCLGNLTNCQNGISVAFWVKVYNSVWNTVISSNMWPSFTAGIGFAVYVRDSDDLG